jgi:putative membrane protein
MRHHVHAASHQRVLNLHSMKKDATELAVDRTIMAADRSLMAWVRTGLSMISFGFTIYKFLDYSREQLIASGKAVSRVSSPSVVGLIMIGLGILSLVFGILENIYTIRELKEQFTIHRKRYAMIMAVMLTIFGMIIFLGIIFQFNGIGTL